MSGPAAARPGDVDLSLSQLLGAWRVLCEASPRAVFEAHDGTDYYFSGLDVAFFNMAFLGQRNLDASALADHAARAKAWAAPHEVPWFFVVTHERLAPGVDATAALDRAGFGPALPLTGMVADDVTPESMPAPAGLDVLVAGDDQACEALIDINAAAYGMSLDACRDSMARHAFWAPHVPALGLIDGVPVTCAAVFPVEGCRYVAWVATKPTHQRRGLADAAMRHALKVAADRYGAGPTVLHATDAGKPVYERMGYRTISSHTLFLEKRFLEGH